MERAASEIVLQSAKRGQAGELSPRFWHCFEFVHAGHRFWRKWHRAKLYHDHLSGMILGRTLDYFLGGNSTVQSVAQMVLIADRVAACADRVLKVERCLKEIDVVWNRRCLRHVRARPIAGNTAPWDTLYGKLTEEKERWITLLILTFSCLKEMLDMSGLLLDAAEYFSYTADREQAVTECFVNCLGLWRRLNRDLPYLAEQIKENEEIIDHLFEAFGLDWKAQKMLEGFLQVQQVSAAIREKGSALLSQIAQVNQATWSQLKEWYSLVTLQEQRFPEPSPLTLYSDDKLGFSPYFRRDVIHSFPR